MVDLNYEYLLIIASRIAWQNHQVTFGTAMSASTVDALFRRGIPRNLAERLATEFTLAQLRQLPVDRLVSLGLSQADAKGIRTIPACRYQMM